MDAKAASTAQPRKCVSPRGLTLIRSFEGVCDGNPLTVNLDPYLDPADLWTIGYGHVIRLNGRRLKGQADRKLARQQYPNGLTSIEVENLLAKDVLPFEDYLNGVMPWLGQNQFDALVSFSFNAGLAAFEKPVLGRNIKARDFSGIAIALKSWIYAKGKVSKGLVRRRAAEAALFLTPDEVDA